MSNWVIWIMAWISFSLNVSAAVFYVDANSPGPLPPYTSWSTAATNIQDAINLTATGDMVLVTNGIYAFGGQAIVGTLTNRVALTNAITVQSVNGPWVTTIQGAGATNGPNAIRCAWLTNGASLNGFTLSRGATLSSGDLYASESGGGIWCASSNAWVNNCVIVSNTAYYEGGGICFGTVKGSLISGNRIGYNPGGAAYKNVIDNCTIISNAITGVDSPIAITNSILYYNVPTNIFYFPSTVSHSCTFPLAPGMGNFTNAPDLFVDGIHLAADSPCIGAGVAIGAGADIFGRMWFNPPSIGCAEWQPSPLVSVPVVHLSGNPVGFSIGTVIAGASPSALVWLKNGSPLQNDGHFGGMQSTNLVANGVLPNDMGGYQLIVSNAFGVVTSGVVQVVIHCVDAGSTNPVAPYLSFSTAATNIQDAITAALPGEIVLVTNGLYATGGKSMDGMLTNRVSVDKAILVQSVNGASATVIQGAWDPISTNGVGSVRCAWLTNSAILSGFTLQGGATEVGNAVEPYTAGAGVWGYPLTNHFPGATVAHCLLIHNVADYYGGGAYQVVLNNCTIATNIALTGGGADQCYLHNCVIVGNFSGGTAGGGTDSSHLFNCLLFGNNAQFSGSAANGGTLVNCTVSGNGLLGSGHPFTAVSNAALTNCIVYGNYSLVNVNPNYQGSTFDHCDTDPLPGGNGNVDLNPQLLPDYIHLAATSPCIGAGISSAVSGVDIDGQPWNNPPSMGADEWQPAPIVAAQPSIQANSSARDLTICVVPAGQAPFAFFWTKNGLPIQDDGHYSNSGTANLVTSHFGLPDAGAYQVVITNSSGVATSAVFQVVIHAVSVSGQNPLPPYSAWDTAATNIQDAINVASAGDVILVTNGVYATGGAVVDGSSTNRVAIVYPVSVLSVNGYASTVIQGAWDPASTNGPDSIRCVYLVDGAILNGFTLQNGSTLNAGDYLGPLTSGGGVYCTSTNGIVSNCVLTNNVAVYGGGIAHGTLNNSLLVGNYTGQYGGGAYGGALNNCTVVNNYSERTSSTFGNGAGTYGSVLRNCIIVGNYDGGIASALDNCGDSTSSGQSGQYAYSCMSPVKTGVGNTNASPYFLDLYHVSSLSPGVGDGSAAYASGFDLDGQSWNNPPSMGCSEVVSSNLVGPMSVSFSTLGTNLVLSSPYSFFGHIVGHAASVAWSFGDGSVITNIGASEIHQWTNAGNYIITFTAFNNDNPDGVSTNVAVQVEPLAAPQLQSPLLGANGFQFQFPGQINANYSIQYTTNLTPPIVWQTFQSIYFNTQDPVQIVDGPQTNSIRFYRVVPSIF